MRLHCFLCWGNRLRCLRPPSQVGSPSTVRFKERRKMSYRENGEPLFFAVVLFRAWCRWSPLSPAWPWRNVAAIFFHTALSSLPVQRPGWHAFCSFPVNMLLLHWDSHLRKQKAGKQYVEKLVSMETAFFFFPLFLFFSFKIRPNRP